MQLQQLVSSATSNLRMLIGGYPSFAYFPMVMTPTGMRPLVRIQQGVRRRALSPPDGDTSKSFTPDGFPTAIPQNMIRQTLDPIGFDLRAYEGIFNDNFLIIDDEFVAFQNTAILAQRLDQTPSSVSWTPRLVRSREVALRLARAFDRIWETGDAVLHLDAEAIAGTERSRRIQLAAKEYWDDLISRLARQPEQLYSLDWRAFEKLVAELLARDGFDVKLTPPSGDKGVDIFARKPDEFGGQLYVVQCKRHNQRNPVKPHVVRELRSAIADEGASKGVIVTTSTFTAGVLEKVKDEFEYLIHLRDHRALVDWLWRNS